MKEVGANDCMNKDWFGHLMCKHQRRKSEHIVNLKTLTLMT